MDGDGHEGQQRDQRQTVEHALDDDRRQGQRFADVTFAAQEVGSPEFAQPAGQEIVRGEAHDQHWEQNAQRRSCGAAEDHPPAHRAQPVAEQCAHRGRDKPDVVDVPQLVDESCQVDSLQSENEENDGQSKTDDSGEASLHGLGKLSTTLLFASATSIRPSAANATPTGAALSSVGTSLTC